MDMIWEKEDNLNKMRELIEKVSKKEAACECDYDKVSEDWFNYIEEKFHRTLTDHELEMLNEKFTEEMDRHQKRISH